MEKMVSVMFSYVFFLANSVFLKTVMIRYQKNLWPISLFSFSALNCFQNAIAEMITKP